MRERICQAPRCNLAGVKTDDKDQGVSDYSIFWDKDTNLLFAVQKCDSDTNSQDTTNVDPITQKWWDMMADIMEVNPDNSPVSIPLEELFHMD